MSRAVVVVALLLAPSVAPAQGIGDLAVAIAERGQAKAPRSAVDVTSAIGCRQASPDEVVVCSPAKPKYGPDADVMKAAEPPPPLLETDRRELATQTRCGTGGNLCDSGQIPVTAIALAGAKAVMMAAQGEDWKEVFRTRPDEYQRYLDARSRRRARSRGGSGSSTSK